MTRFYDPPFRLWYRTDVADHEVEIRAWDGMRDEYEVYDCCCAISRVLSASMVAVGTRAPWRITSVEEADAWLEARVSLGLLSVRT